jgi:hypothetical protein
MTSFTAALERFYAPRYWNLCHVPGTNHFQLGSVSVTGPDRQSLTTVFICRQQIKPNLPDVLESQKGGLTQRLPSAGGMVVAVAPCVTGGRLVVVSAAAGSKGCRRFQSRGLSRRAGAETQAHDAESDGGQAAPLPAEGLRRQADCMKARMELEIPGGSLATGRRHQPKRDVPAFWWFGGRVCDRAVTCCFNEFKEHLMPCAGISETSNKHAAPASVSKPGMHSLAL